jgi:hypothetical protein
VQHRCLDNDTTCKKAKTKKSIFKSLIWLNPMKSM